MLGEMTVIDTLLEENEATNDGSGLANLGGRTVTQSTLDFNNAAVTGGGIVNEEIYLRRREHIYQQHH